MVKKDPRENRTTNQTAKQGYRSRKSRFRQGTDQLSRMEKQGYRSADVGDALLEPFGGAIWSHATKQGYRLLDLYPCFGVAYAKARVQINE